MSRDPSETGPREAVPGEVEAFDERPAAALLPLYAAVRAHPYVVALVAAITLAACCAWLLQRSPVYEAHSSILVTPLIERETSFTGLPIVRTSPGDPTRTVETAASVVSSPEASDLAATTIEGMDGSAVRSAVTVQPIEDTNVIDVMARSSDPERSAEIASAYAEAVLEVRRMALAPLVHDAIRRTRRQLATIADPTGDTAVELRTKLSQLETIRNGDDPTLSIAQLADVPSSPSGRPTWMLVLAGVFAGILLGTGTAILLRMATPRRIEDSDSVLAILDLPIRARMPAHPTSSGGSKGERRRSEQRLAFRLLRDQLDFRAAGPASSAAAANAGKAGAATAFLEVEPGDGGAASSAGLVEALLQDQAIVVAVELDSHEPGLGRLLDVEPRHKLTKATDPRAPLVELVNPADDARPLGLIAADPEASSLRGVVTEARRTADHVVINVGPTLPPRKMPALLHDVSETVLVVRLGHTRPESLLLLSEALSGTSVLDNAGYLILEP